MKSALCERVLWEICCSDQWLIEFSCNYHTLTSRIILKCISNLLNAWMWFQCQKSGLHGHSCVALLCAKSSSRTQCVSVPLLFCCLFTYTLCYASTSQCHSVASGEKLYIVTKLRRQTVKTCLLAILAARRMQI